MSYRVSKKMPSFRTIECDNCASMISEGENFCFVNGKKWCMECVSRVDDRVDLPPGVTSAASKAGDQERIMRDYKLTDQK